MRRVVPVVVGLLLAAAVLPLLPASPAGAAPGIPNLTSPAPNAIVSTNPVFTWDAATNAVRYVVRVSTTEDMGNLISGGSINTTNLSATFTADMPTGDLWWQVRAFDVPSGGTPTDSPARKFTKSPISAPQNLQPAGSPAVLDFPTGAPTFSWNAVAGAVEYELTFDNESSFTPPYTLPLKTTSATAFTLDTPLTVDQTFYWRVRAKAANNAFSLPSVTGSFKFQWDNEPGLVYPPNTNTVPIEEVIFEWTPTPGAVEYKLFYTPNSNFSNPTEVNVKSTRYSPPVTLNNGAYYWKVQAVTAFNGLGPLSAQFTFTRAWPGGAPVDFGVNKLDKIELQSPPNNAVDLQEVVLQWSAQRLASRYQVELSTDINFSPDLTDTCITNHTTLSPMNGCGVDPDPGVAYYWRVKGLDDPLPVQGTYSDVRRFVYRPSAINLTSPPNGTSTSTPVLTWDPLSSLYIGKYQVQVFDETGDQVKEIETYNTFYVPDGLSSDPTKSLHTWKVQTIDSANRVGSDFPVSRTFEYINPPATFATPEQTSPNNAEGTRVPPLTWQAVTGADRYTVWVSTGGSDFFAMDANVQATGVAHQGSNIIPGDYLWYVEAKNGNTVISTSTVTRTFKVKVLPKSAPGPAWPACSLDEACIVRYDMPTFDWTPVVGASHYRVYIATDENFTNVVSGTPYKALYSQLTPRISLPDNDAGLAYYWYARPCYGTSPEVCGAGPNEFFGQPDSPVRAFHKTTKPLQQLLPAYNDTQANDITFSWRDFQASNCNLPPAPVPGSFRCRDAISPALPDPNVVTQEARQYKIEVSYNEDFSTVIDSATVDQTTYTAANKTYEEGPIYWRVAPIDGSNNILTWSVCPGGGNPLRPCKVNKVSPPGPALTPTDNQAVGGIPTFSWQPQPFDAEYDIEVYKNPTQAITAANLVLSENTEIAALTPTEAFPPGAYGWRFRRVDVDGREGAWSFVSNGNPNGFYRFTVSNPTLTLTTPGPNAVVSDPNRLLFTWQPATRAVEYKFEANTQSNFQGTKVEQDVTTVMTAWAPRAPYLIGEVWWRVTAYDSDGNLIATSETRKLNSGEPGSRYVSIPPVRVLDSRNGTGWSGRLAAASPRTLKVAGGSLPAPSDATAVVINVTAVESDAGSFITVFPTGSPRPTASNLNFNAGEIIPNLVTVKVGTNGNVDFFTSVGNVHVVADMVGFYDSDNGDQFTPLEPSRLLDSRDSGTEAYWSPAGKLAQAPRDLKVAGRGGVPNDATAAIVNITVTDGNAQSFLMAYPTGSPQPPQASNLNFLPGQIIPNLAIVKLGTEGKIRLFNAAGTVNVIVDVVGYFKPGVGSKFHPLEPNRVLDTRVDNGLSGKFNNNQTRDLQVSNRGGNDVTRNAPTGATAVVLNTTAVSGSALSYLTLFPDETPKPLQGSNLNFSPGQIIPNLVTVKLSPTGKVSIYNNSGNVDVLADLVGYYSTY